MRVEEFKLIDKTFNESMFLSKVNNVFIKFFTAIMLEELEDIRHFVSEDVYKYAEDIVKRMQNNGWRQMYDELNVKNSEIVSIEVNESVYKIKVFLQSRYLDYIMNLSNDSLVSGNNWDRVQKNWMLTFSRKVEVDTQGVVRKCPGCGAPMNVNYSGKCLYCGAIYNQSDYDWVLTKLENS